MLRSHRHIRPARLVMMIDNENRRGRHETGGRLARHFGHEIGAESV